MILMVSEKQKTMLICSVKQYKTLKEKHYIKIDLYHYSFIRLRKIKKF